MALMTWTIELRVDFDAKSKEKIMESDIRSHAKGILTTARLLADGRAPEIAITTSDMFVGSEEVALFTDGELEA
jgi:hypothetical protein